MVASQTDLSPSSDDLSQVRAPLGEAQTLPSTAYTSEVLYEQELAQIFRREWLCVGRADQVADPGDYFSIDLLGEPLLVVRGEDQQIRVMSRACRHRAAEVATGAGTTRAFRCPYHAWTYRLDGQLHAAPLMSDVAGFYPARCSLHRFASEEWEGWVFVNLDGSAAPLGPRLKPLSQQLANYRLSHMVATDPIEFDSPFNWKILVDNFMEAYHHIAIHGQSLEPLFPASVSRVARNDGPYSLLEMPARTDLDPAEQSSTLPDYSCVDDAERARLLAAVVFPCHLFSPSAEALVWYQLLPDSYDHFTLRIHVCLPPETLQDPACQQAIEEFRALVQHIHSEDISACEAVWRGIQAPSCKPGFLSMLERSLWQFNQWWLERMALLG